VTGLPSDPFESARFLCNWADRAVRQFHERSEAFGKLDPYMIAKELDPKSGKVEVKVKLTSPFPYELRGYASDAIKNIRDALDQATAAASFILTDKRSSRRHFPFGESADDLENSLSRRKVRHCKDIPEELFPKLRAIKPYTKDGDTALKALSLVAGDHKHEVALALGAQTNEIQIGTLAVEKGGWYLPPIWRAETQEMILCWFWPGGKAKLDIQFPMFIAFDELRLRWVPAGDVLSYWLTRCRDIIDGLEAAAFGREEGARSGDYAPT
jgi:hypothetical protein